jgi:hypothetical protein
MRESSVIQYSDQHSYLEKAQVKIQAQLDDIFKDLTPQIIEDVFTKGSADELTLFLRDIVDKVSDHLPSASGLSEGRALYLLRALTPCLVHMRDTNEITLNPSVFGSFVELNQIIKLSFRTELPANPLSSLNKFLDDIPGFLRSSDAETSSVSDFGLKIHNNITAHYVDAFNRLDDMMQKSR